MNTSNNSITQKPIHMSDSTPKQLNAFTLLYGMVKSRCYIFIILCLSAVLIFCTAIPYYMLSGKITSILSEVAYSVYNETSAKNNNNINLNNEVDDECQSTESIDLANSIDAKSKLTYLSQLYSSVRQYILHMIGTRISADTLDRIIYTVFAYAMICLISSVIYFLNQIFVAYIHTFAVGYIRDYATSYAMEHSYLYFMQNTAGAITDKISNMVNSSREVITIAFNKIIPIILYLIICIAYFSYHYYMLGIIFMFWVTTHTIWNYTEYVNKYDNEWKKINKISNSIYAKITNIFNNIFLVKSLSSHEFESKYIKHFSIKHTNLLHKILIMYAKLTLMFHVFFIISLRLGFVLTLIYAYLSNKIDFVAFSGIFGLFSSAAHKAYDAVEGLQDLVFHLAIVNNSVSILQTKHGVRDDYPDQYVQFHRAPEILFEDLTFLYDENDSSGSKYIFCKLNLRITPGEKVAFIGLSGSGKSTLINLIMRIFNVTNGRILIDGQDIDMMSQKSLKNAISYIPQKQFLFDRPLFVNIGYGNLEIRQYILNNIDVKFYNLPRKMQTMIVNASTQAQCHDRIMELHHGYDSVYGIDINLSGGEAQRVMIAQAIINQNSKILLLDEATAALDNKNQQLIQKTINDLAKDRTTIIVAHRLSTITDCRIIVFEDGRIIEDGYHDELIGTNSRYKQMLNIH